MGRQSVLSRNNNDYNGLDDLLERIADCGLLMQDLAVEADKWGLDERAVDWLFGAFNNWEEACSILKRTAF